MFNTIVYDTGCSVVGYCRELFDMQFGAYEMSNPRPQYILLFAFSSPIVFIYIYTIIDCSYYFYYCIFDVPQEDFFLHTWCRYAHHSIRTRRLYSMTMSIRPVLSLNIQLCIISHLETKTKLYYYLLFILCYNTYSYSIMARAFILHVLCAIIIIIYTIIITLRNNFRKKSDRGTYVCYRIKSLYECYYRYMYIGIYNTKYYYYSVAVDRFGNKMGMHFDCIIRKCLSSLWVFIWIILWQITNASCVVCTISIAYTRQMIIFFMSFAQEFYQMICCNKCDANIPCFCLTIIRNIG